MQKLKAIYFILVSNQFLVLTEKSFTASYTGNNNASIIKAVAITIKQLKEEHDLKKEKK